MRLFANSLLALSFASSFIVPSLANAHQARRHHVHRQGDLARRESGEVDLHKRDGDRFTYYAVGLGACGWTNVPSDFIVALDSAQFDEGGHCGQMISIQANGKSATAQIADSCPGCPYGGLDFSQGLFTYFDDISVGVLYGSWSYASGGSSPPPSPAPAPAPSPSPSPPPPPPPPPTTTPNIPLTIQLPTPTTTSQPPPTTTSAPPTTSSASTPVSASNSSSVAIQTSTMPVGVVPPAASDSVLIDLDLGLVYIGRFLSACSAS